MKKDSKFKTMRKSFAMTLAEILLTLGVIGVLAALTIPTLIHYFQDIALQNAFKKSYSTLMSAINTVTQENGGVLYNCYSSPSYNYTNSECAEKFWPALKSKLNVSKTFVGPVDGINIPDYTSTELIVAQGGSLRNGTCSGGKTVAKSLKTVWILADGSMLMSYIGSFEYPVYAVLDTNGLKKPNKWGYDLFQIELLRKTPTSTITINDTLCGAKEKNGYWVNDLLMK